MPRKRSTLIKAIEAAHNLGLNVIAEGVEIQAQLEFLQSHDCSFAQGYFLGRPASAQEITHSLVKDQGPNHINSVRRPLSLGGRKMSHRTIYRLMFFGFSLLILASVVTAVAASNTVPSSRLADKRSTINANVLKPLNAQL